MRRLLSRSGQWQEQALDRARPKSKRWSKLWVVVNLCLSVYLRAQRFGRAGAWEHDHAWEEHNSEEKPDRGGMRKLGIQLQSIRMVFRIVERIVNAGRVVSEMKSSRGIRVLLNRD